LVHRDIKPSNVIFVGGVPKLADIGLVTSIDATRSFVGTEGFFPPEGPGTPQADIYSLGKLLYEVATGKDRREFPELPTDLASPGEQAGLAELNAIILKACQPDPVQRYATAAPCATISNGSNTDARSGASGPGRAPDLVATDCAASGGGHPRHGGRGAPGPLVQ